MNMFRSLLKAARCYVKVEKCANIAHLSTESVPSRMQAWCLYHYGKDSMPILDKVDVQTSLKANEVLVKVEAASLNPIDAMMMEGFGSVLFQGLRKRYKSQFGEFPVVLGRDFSGVVVKRGAQVTRVKEGDEVCLKMSQKLQTSRILLHLFCMYSCNQQLLLQ